MQEYGGTDRRGKVDRRSGWDRRKSKRNLSLLEMLTTHDIDGQCRKITIWLKQHYNLQGIGILLRDPTLSRPYFYADNVSEDILKDLSLYLYKAFKRCRSITSVNQLSIIKLLCGINNLLRVLYVSLIHCPHVCFSFVLCA